MDRNGAATATLDGDLDEVRLSRGARYEGATFEPARRSAVDGETVLLLQMDGTLGPYLRDARAAGARTAGRALVIRE